MRGGNAKGRYASSITPAISLRVHRAFRRVRQRTDRQTILAHSCIVPPATRRLHSESDPNSSIPLEAPMNRTPNKLSAKARPKNGANLAHRRKSGGKLPAQSKDGVQGEGNYAAAREFNEAERKFVASGKVAAAARAAAPETEAERQAMFAAEEEGKRRAKQ
jgi:hypothetical protein